MSANTRTLLLAPFDKFLVPYWVFFFSFLYIWDVAHLNCYPFLPIVNHFYPFSISHIGLSPLTGLCLRLSLPVLLRKLGRSFLRSVLRL